MDGEHLAASATTSTHRSSRRRFTLGLLGLALTVALGTDDSEARRKHNQKKKRGKKRKRNRKPKDTPPP